MATPDHWHAPGAILAADAGKHVYVEKPCSHNVREGRLLADAAARNKIVIQVGTQARSTPTVKAAIDRIKGGAIGDVLAAKAWNSQLRRNLGKVQATKPPDHLDYELWQGPVPEAPFFSNRVPSMWRFFKDYGAGDIGNDGVHNIDVAVWGMGFDRLSRYYAGRRKPGLVLGYGAIATKDIEEGLERLRRVFTCSLPVAHVASHLSVR
jgi:predicted dehydrogenase